MIDVMADTPTDAALRDALMHASRALRRRWHEALTPWELSPHEHRALRTVRAAEAPLRLGDVARTLHIAPRSATEVVDRLESRGLTHRVPDPTDRRAVCVQLTDQGAAVCAELDEARDAQASEFFAMLDDADRAHLARILDALT